MSETGAVAAFMDRTGALLARDAGLSPLGAGLVAALQLGLTRDSRGFSRLLGIEHSLVLREIGQLAGPAGPVVVTGRDPRTLRTSLALADRA
jgi:hypothetical protein